MLYNKLKINKEEGDICPICEMEIKGKNGWVRYHVSYKPEIVILACKYCNKIERVIRLGLPIDTINDTDMARRMAILNLNTKFSIVRTYPKIWNK
jgi:hypothetical protein